MNSLWERKYTVLLLILSQCEVVEMGFHTTQLSLTKQNRKILLKKYVQKKKKKNLMAPEKQNNCYNFSVLYLAEMLLKLSNVSRCGRLVKSNASSVIPESMKTKKNKPITPESTEALVQVAEF